MNEHDMKEAFVTDQMSADQLHKMMNNPAFGSFDSYRPLDNMVVETTKAEQHDGIGPHGAVSTVKRYFKFVKSDDGWEVHEVNESGEVELKESSTSEPSSVEYGRFMLDYYNDLEKLLKQYKIRKIDYHRTTEYDGTVNGHSFFYVEGKTGVNGRYVSKLFIDDKEVDVYQSRYRYGTLNEVNNFSIQRLVKLLESDDLSNFVFRDVDTLDDYEESLVEDVEMSDAQRLALQELDSCLEYGELDAEKHALAYQIQWDINFEDVLLFINGIDIPLKDIKHVEYGDCSGEYDGCYSVTLHNGTTKQYGWHDWDATASLTCIDCNESLQSNEEGAYQVYKVGTNGKFTALLKLFDTHAEADEYAATLHVPTKIVYVPQTLIEDHGDGWDKPFDWTERYVKDGFVIFNNYQGAWHLEQTRPKTKHIGNYKSLEAAKAAGNAEINKRNAKNKDKPVQFGVHSFTSDSIVFRGTEDECAEYINKNGLENEAEIYMMDANDRHYLEEAAGKRFNNGDRVYVKVANRQGNVTKMISDDVVEVEFEDNGTYPARIDRFYADEIELIDMTPDLDDNINEQYWAVFAKDTTTGKEYCAGVYSSERDAYYWAGMDSYSDVEYHYGNFKYRVERVSDYTDDLDKSRRELDTLKLSNHSAYKENDIDDDF